MKVAIFGQNYSDNTYNCVTTLLNFLEKKQSKIVIEKEFFKALQLPEKSQTLGTFTQLDKSFDLLISIGGDGTILRAVTYVRDYNIPIVGINTGRLGFLATIQTNEIENALSEIFNKNYKISKRSLLSVTIDAKNKELEEINFALNEIAVSRNNTTSMITVETHLNGEYLTSYWADGLIISTPTGSTGYSLSCGGPVITPEANNLVLTPIAPHNLNARPLVIPDDTEITLNVDGREDQFLLSLDSRIVTLPNSVTITVKVANFKINMVELITESFLDTLRKKMLWGEDRRN
ncbi:MAG: NAD kinase [Bacteroidia bacterium]|nr:NAD kinase [Bacteroidia bacterium]